MTINPNNTDQLHRLSPFDQCLTHIQTGLFTLFGEPEATRFPVEHHKTHTTTLTDDEKKHSGRLMRVNAVGEICAQGLYLGQAITAHRLTIKHHMLTAAYDEINHLVWCNDRLRALNTHPSYLNPLWFLSSITLGMAMGLAGDAISLGFIAETEKQVMAHIEKHLHRLPPADKDSATVLKQMYIDERAHAADALDAGGQPLPIWVKTGMRLMAKVITKTSYYL